MQWFKEGVRISPSDRVVYSIKGDLLSLTIHNAQLEDEGNYRSTVDVRSVAPLFVLSRVLKLHNIILICA